VYHHAVALTTTTYHKKVHKSRDYLGLFGFELIIFCVIFLLAYQFLVCRDSKSGEHFSAHRLCRLSLISF